MIDQNPNQKWFKKLKNKRNKKHLPEEDLKKLQHQNLDLDLVLSLKNP